MLESDRKSLEIRARLQAEREAPGGRVMTNRARFRKIRLGTVAIRPPRQ